MNYYLTLPRWWADQRRCRFCGITWEDSVHSLSSNWLNCGHVPTSSSRCIFYSCCECYKVRKEPLQGIDYMFPIIYPEDYSL